MGLPPREEPRSEQLHAPIVRLAARALADKNIPVVEYGQQVQYRGGDPMVLLLVEWAVPDELLSFSSQVLSKYGFSRVPPSTKVTDRYGPWERGCIVHKHKLDESSPIYLYPLSFVGLALQDTVKVTSTFDRTLPILTPKPPMYMVSLLRHLLYHPVNDSFRLRVIDDLLSFISFYILRDKPLNTKEVGWEDEESEEDFQQRLEEAVLEMKSWDWGASREEYLCIAESVVRDCRSIYQLSNC
ncbi:hypothetical protein ASPZODRAFT_58781 [Penicilliopsis zonata CBS 506.65]|uniref:Uncharacterized protein n=1 Tax=Penicilliopsis zonata CBS 506.65 TaxID=1073090 RepID=A0A1L9STA2_9EURO|nr:hypothetical protein ASPZODRAFT_58781 [Penicilliopsis zonata CBS 506.65]OJJ50323.1 hypothetical protein ASPZODRAFT_58781 [Penicilliopsis zonata CBS 506.65]